MRLQAKLFLPVLLGGLCLGIIVHFYWGPSQLENERRTLTKQNQAMLATMAPGIFRALLAGDLASLYATLDQQMENHADTWKWLEVDNKNKKRVYPLKSSPAPEGEYIIHLQHQMMIDGEVFGYIRLALDTQKQILNEQERIEQLEWFALLIFGLIGVSGAIWQNKTIKRPVSILNDAVGELAKGNYEHSLPKPGQDEIGNLAANFEQMKLQLKSTQAKLEEAAKKARKSETYQRTVLNNVADGIIIIDEGGAIESFNAAAEKIFGYGIDEIKGCQLAQLIHMPSIMEAGHSSGVALVEGRIELNGVRKDGSVFPMALATQKMQYGDQSKFATIARDVTERHRVDRLKNEFVSTVSHELRTPLTSINGALKLINGGALGEVSGQMAEMLKIAENNTDRLLCLVSDILDMQKIEAGKMVFSFSELALLPFLEKAVQDNEHYAIQHEVTLMLAHSAQDCLIEADSVRLDQVLDNLISNAIKFSPKGGDVVLSSIVNDDHAVITVSDSGSGIPEEFRDKIFDQFTQSDASDTRKVGGTGLGMSIAKAIVEEHKGTIDFESELGKGTIFYINLPIVITPS